jgi:IS4 transposase
MYQGRTVFAQLLDFLPRHSFRRCVERYRGNYRVRGFTCWNQFLTMAFAQLTFRESLRDIEACLCALHEKLYHVGIRGHVRRNTLAVANEKRDWRIYADFAQVLIHEARRLYADESLGLDLKQTVYALDSTTIDLCLNLFPWAHFRRAKGAIKLHTLLELHSNIPSFVWMTHGKFVDMRILDFLVPEPGSIYVMDRGYIDFERLHHLTKHRAIFVTRSKQKLIYRRVYSHPVDYSLGLICDQTIRLTGPLSRNRYPDKLRRIRYRDADQDRVFTFLTNDFTLPAFTVAELYHHRWRIELFFKWIKQHLRIKAFYGTSVNAVKTQIWIAITVYVLVAIVKKRLEINRDLYTILQILSLSLFEKLPLHQALTETTCTLDDPDVRNQLELFNF